MFSFDSSRFGDGKSDLGDRESCVLEQSKSTVTTERTEDVEGDDDDDEVLQSGSRAPQKFRRILSNTAESDRRETGLGVELRLCDPSRKTVQSPNHTIVNFFDDFDQCAKERFRIRDGPLVSITNVVSRYFLSVENVYHQLIPVAVLTERITLDLRDRVQVQPRNSKFRSMSLSLEWEGVLKGTKNLVFTTGRVHSPGLRSDMKSAYNAHIFAAWLTVVTGVAIVPYALHMTNHVCAFRVDWCIDLARLRKELCTVDSAKRDSSTQEFPAEMVRPYKNRKPGNPLRSVLMMFFKRGAVNIIGIRNRVDYESVTDLAYKFCKDYRLDNSDALTVYQEDDASRAMEINALTMFLKKASKYEE